VAQIDALLGRAGISPGQTKVSFNNMDAAEATSLATAWLAGIERLSEPGSEYREVARSAVEEWGSDRMLLPHLHGVLIALRADYEAGFVVTLRELIHADVFGDFLESAEHLIAAGYKDAAGVIVGSVLEEHLRKLSTKAGVPIVDAKGGPRKADSLNADLVKAGVYNTLQQKAVTAWLGLRNHAAHGNYSQYDKAQVGALLRDVREFLIRLPA
jgi:hypothetical protein